ncbi:MULTISPECIES: hypothetical protein [Haloferacaceae]|uniref:Uncharacterized protein n=1 Tax=Halorubrum glutamatedens TaxID=2707018 RepID=A0ABD5QMJ9_9EURY|nr:MULTISPECIES: hypothetical protein [Haloferacales]
MTDENGDGSGGVEGTRLARRWQALDRGWQALLLGLAVVAVHLVIQPF